MRKKTTVFTFFAILATCYIFYNSLKIAPESSAESGVIVSFIINLFSMINRKLDLATVTLLVRKAAHIFEFFMQGFFISLAYYFGKYTFSRRIVNLLFFGLLTACTDEMMQIFVSGRAGMVVDIWIDFIGVLLAAFLYFIISAAGRRKLR